jgi:phosphoglycerol transferase MdoB-like AlkP superfamily enzyme
MQGHLFLVLVHGKSVADRYSKRNVTPGSHIDIAPTLIELVAPPKRAYYSSGSSLLIKNTAHGVGIGYNKAIDTIKILEFSKNYGIKKQNINNNKLTNKNNLRNKKKHDNLMSLAWYYTTRGDSIN